MPENEIPPDVLAQARAAGAGARAGLSTPEDGPGIEQPDAPDIPDMSNVPDPYDVHGQTAYRADQREAAIEARDAAPEPQVPEPSVETPVGELSESSYEAMLEAAQQFKDATEQKQVTTATPEATADTVAPERDASLEPSPEPQAPEIDRE